jgi:hypothetical protein
MDDYLNCKETPPHSDMTTIASSPEPEFSQEISDYGSLTAMRIDFDIQPRKLNRKQILMKEERSLRLRKEIKELTLENAKLKTENTHLSGEIEYCRGVFAAHKAPSNVGKSSSSMLVFSALAVLGCVVTTSESQSFKGDTRKLVMLDEGSRWWGPAVWVVLVSLTWLLWRRVGSYKY